MDKFFYPAIFHTADEGGFWISFPDIPECLTQGNTMENAYEMAFDALGLCITDRLENHMDLPTPSTPQSIVLDENEVIVVIELDLLKYKKKHSSKSIKKTLTIPEWLNEEALKYNLNFSQILQKALITELQALQ